MTQISRTRPLTNVEGHASTPRCGIRCHYRAQLDTTADVGVRRRRTA